MENKMSIDEKLAFVRKALEMGANVEVNFHNIKGKKEAKQAAVELSKPFNLSHRHKSHDNTNWYKIKNEDWSLEAAIFYDDDFLKEDVILDGMKEGEEIA
jgi:hypothetical protein